MFLVTKLYTIMVHFDKYTIENFMSTLRNLFSRECKFIAGAAKVEQIPPSSLPEVAFIGRSNVGKSSLINSLLNRKSLARVSQNPGCTKQINFYQLHDVMCLVDLPGYGFARISSMERNTWNDLIHFYLRGRSQLKRVFLLIDSRHPLKKIDTDTMKFLDEYGISYQIVLTKVDKSTILKDIMAEITTRSINHGACHPVCLTTSSVSKEGVDTMQDEILSII